MSVEGIEEKVEQFKAADAAYETHNKAQQELALDLAIADRSGDEEAIQRAKAETAAHRQNWHGHYMARQDAARSVLTALGIDPSAFRNALPY